jgi:hypothetical protein
MVIAGSQPDWTPEEDAILRDLWDRGIPIKLIAPQIGRTPGAVRKRRDKLVLKRRHSMVQQRLKAVRVNLTDREYWSVRQKSKELNITVADYIRNLIRADGLPIS